MFYTIITAIMAFLVASTQAGIFDHHEEATSYISGHLTALIHGGHGEELHGHESHHVEHHAYPKYKFSYGVEDPHTGDHKSQEETRDGDVVKGHYTVADPDGTLRTVHYTADKHNGFNAIVSKSGHSVHPEVYGKGHEEGIGESEGHGLELSYHH